MDIYEYIVRDHERVAALFEQIIGARTAHTRKRYFDHLRLDLILHAETEDATFYEALRNHPKARGEIGHAEGEHEEIEMYLTKLSGRSTESRAWMEMLGELKHAVEHHVKEEETEIFAMAKQILSQDEADQLAAVMDGLKRSVLSKAA